MEESSAVRQGFDHAGATRQEYRVRGAESMDWQALRQDQDAALGLVRQPRPG
jgi:hypothetical protein